MKRIDIKSPNMYRSRRGMQELAVVAQVNDVVMDGVGVLLWDRVEAPTKLIYRVVYRR